MLFLSQFGYSQSLPSQYYPNQQIEDNLDSITENFSRIEAYRNSNENPPDSIFSDLKEDFEKVFPRLPQTPDYRVVYEQCNIAVDWLSSWYDYDRFVNFRSRCLSEIRDVFQQINRNYTVLPNISANPQSWSAPLTVTFDARWSIDPSNDTIPSNNYYWYYKDDDGNERQIWQWPVVNHTFEQEWNYVVHLTVRSVNHQNHGIMDWSDTVNIDVSPKSAVTSVHVNNQRLSNDNEVKLWIQEAEDGIIVDGSWTYPTWWRTIERTNWEITWPEWYSHSFSRRWSPGSFRISLPNDWKYWIEMSITDNENNELSEEFPLIVSDPVAKIRSNPREWNTSTEFNFDASPSYSIQSRIVTYRWTIFDPDWNQIDTLESKSFNRNFTRPWNYNVRLTAIDQQWNQNEEVHKVHVASTEPVPQFNKIPVEKWDKPSKFILDASGTYDVDEISGYTDLEYEWNFSNANNVEVIRSFQDWQKLLVSFEEKGEYDIRLTVRDEFGKSESVERNVEIKSSLRPQLTINPFATQIWETLNFSVDWNKSISYYDWDFGDGSSRNTQSSSLSHSYDSTWVYQVSLSATTPWGESNTVSRDVFIWQKGYPVAAYEVTYDDTILSAESLCETEEDGEKVEYPAFEIDRYQQVRIDASNSINSHGRSDDLRIDFRPENDQTYNQDNIRYDFNEKWCTYINLRVEDENINKVDNTKIWFDVQNALPELDNLEMTFPQYGNEVWIWFWQQQTHADVFEKKHDPIIVRLRAKNPRDPDWHISYFVRYYYKESNPNRLLEVKTTPVNIPNTVFSVPRMPWEFVFGVKMVDNDWWEVNSEEIIWKWPSLFFPPSEDNPDIPMVSVSTDSKNAMVWEEVVFDVNSRILWNQEDFEANRTIRYDFNWDWNYDLTTKSDRVTHIYEQSWEYRPRVKVTYRWYAWVETAEKIDVRQWLVANFLYDHVWKTAIFRDVSLWDIEESEFCLDMRKCRNWEDDYIISNESEFVFDYEDIWRKVVSIRNNDEYWNTDQKRETLELEDWDGDFQLMSVPNAVYTWWSYQIDVGSNLDNTINFYVKSDIDWKCFIDYDITYDSTGDGSPHENEDLPCDQLWKKTYTPNAWSTVARLYYEKGWQLESKDIKINFLDFDIDMPDDVLEIYDNLTDIINELSNDWQQGHLRTLLINLRNNIASGAGTDSLVIQIYDWIDENQWNLSYDIQEDIIEIMDYLTDSGIEAAMWWTEYEIAKSNILTFMPSAKDADLKRKFNQIEDAGWDRQLIKSLLQEILQMASDQLEKWNIDNMDYNIIQNDICQIMDYYDILSKVCWTYEEPDEDYVDEWWWFAWVVIKIIFYILAAVVVLFVILVIIFAIKAKSQSQEYEDQEEEEQNEDEDQGDDGAEEEK